MPRKRSVLIVQPYLPKYRTPFFDGLRQKLEEVDISLGLIAGSPATGQSSRRDATTLEWATAARSMTARVQHRAGQLLLLPRGLADQQDLVIFEQALSNAQLWWRSLRRRGPGPQIATWGHGIVLTRTTTPVEDRTLRWLTNRSDWFFGYTSQSCQSVIEGGFPRSRTTAVQNAVDTSLLLDRERTSVKTGSSLLYLGGLDRAKGIDRLLAAGRLTYEQNPDFRLVVVGDGADRPAVEQMAIACPWLDYKGPIFDPESKREIARTCAGLVLPGRVGLAVVDAFAMGLPVLATDYRWSAPELDYLIPGDNGLISQSTPEAMSACWLAFLSSESLRRVLEDGAVRAGSTLTLEAMVSNFAGGVEAALGQLQT